MAYLLRAFALLIAALTATLGIAASAAPSLTFHADTPNALLAAVTLQAGHIHAGETQKLSVTLQKAPGNETIFTLVITYADGAQQDVVASTLSNVAELSWETPSTARSGFATFQLSTSGCGCGDRSIGQPATSQESSIDGWFVVE